uniref:Adenylate kinase n=1 Tax=Romanomermis culicivorax TaxID=13658 RepID=A0A915J7G7_ROMCU
MASHRIESASRKLMEKRLGSAALETAKSSRLESPKLERKPQLNNEEEQPAEPANRFVDVQRPLTGVNFRKTKLNKLVLLFTAGPGRCTKQVLDQWFQKVTMKNGKVVRLSLDDILRTALEEKRLSEDLYTDNAFDVCFEKVGHLFRPALEKFDSNPETELIVLEGFPTDLGQLDEFESIVSDVNYAVIIDYDENDLRRNLNLIDPTGDSNSLIQDFFDKTLPMIKKFDEKGLLRMIPGELDHSLILYRISDVFKSLAPGIDFELNEPERPTSQARQQGGTVLSNDVAGSSSPTNQAMNKNINVVVMTGAPGSLKSEYCKRLVQQFEGMIHISSGQLIRSFIEKESSIPDDGTVKSEMLKILKNAVQYGDVVPDQYCRDLMDAALSEYPTAFGFVIEGYPRNMAQAKDLEKISYIRRAEADNEALTDEHLQAIKNRLTYFKQHTLPMLKYFDEKQKLKVIEGDRDSDEVYAHVSKIVEEIFIPQESADGKSLDSSKNSK